MANSNKQNIIIGTVATLLSSCVAALFIMSFWSMWLGIFSWILYIGFFVVIVLGALASILFFISSAYLLVRDIMVWFKKRKTVRG